MKLYNLFYDIYIILLKVANYHRDEFNNIKLCSDMAYGNKQHVWFIKEVSQCTQFFFNKCTSKK